ncbi:MAG: dihydrolipoyl dehydrogenase [Nitrospinae bacterium CG11_big_fil_rev_8_21_14_0_20_45_15]|nr:MAG: dihydrolipoyl dehydrogenase [Nitrospinae bacterium CG11_big_fil_rev_8_21_14_0_20_45_15]
MKSVEYDIVVIGGGSAGYACASFAQSAGAQVAIVDAGPLGGLCILRGCMPTKAILRSSDILSLQQRNREFGLHPVSAKADLSAIIDRKNRLIQEFAEYRIDQLRNKRFSLYEERATFLSPTELQVGPHVLKARKGFVIATGSRVADFPIPGLQETGFITSDEALELREIPKSMIVLGGGPVALELAQFYCRIGVNVTLIQRSAHILSAGDEDIARPVEARLREEGMKVFTGTAITKVESRGEEKIIHFTHAGAEKQVSAEIILQALGRQPNSDGLGLDKAGVETDGRKITVDDEMRTSQKHIFAVGDVNGRHEIVHIAIQQGEIAAHNLVYSDQSAKKSDERLNAGVIFTDPAVACVGRTEKECQKENIPYLTASYPFADHGKSMCLGEIHGHVKLLCDPKSGEIIGAHIVGPEAGELIHELIAVMYFRGTVKDLAEMPHYHPTLAEILTYPAEELAEQIKE